MSAAAPAPLVVLTIEQLRDVVRSAVLDALAEVHNAEQAPRLATVEQACAALQISRGTLAKLRAEGLPVVMLGESPRFELGECVAWLRERGSRG